MNEPKYLTKKQLRQILGCPGYLVNYLNDCGRLPVIQQSNGKGYPNLYHPSAVDVIQAHISKRSS